MIDVGTGAGTGTGVVAGGGMNTYPGVGVRFAVSASDVRAEEISGSHVWYHITSREITAFPVSVFSILKQSRPWLQPEFIKKKGRPPILYCLGARWHTGWKNSSNGNGGCLP